MNALPVCAISSDGHPLAQFPWSLVRSRSYGYLPSPPLLSWTISTHMMNDPS